MEDDKIEVLNSVNEYLEILKNGISNMCELIQSGKEKEGINLIPQLADGIGWVIDAVRVTKDVQKKEIDITGLNDYIEESVEALENEDYILVGDLFNYEILPIIETIHGNIKESLVS